MTTLADAVESASVIVACGPGGVGKTSCAAALGVAAAMHTERRVLVVTVDPARRLATALGLRIGGDGETPVTLAGARGHLSVSMLDTSAAWDSLIRRHAPDAATATRILSNALYRNITERFIQSHDYIAMERLHELVGAGEYDLIVVDTPPTRRALDFLDAPTRMAEFFSSRLLRWIVAPARTGLASVAARPFTAVADRILGGPFVGDIAEFFWLLNSMTAGFVTRAHEVQALMADPATGFVVISTHEAVPRDEAAEFVDELSRRQLRVVGWILNRTLPDALATDASRRAVDALAAAPLASAVAALGETEETLSRVREELIVTVREYQRVAALDVAARSVCATRAAVYCAPVLDGEISGLAGLARLGEALWEATAS